MQRENAHRDGRNAQVVAAQQTLAGDVQIGWIVEVIQPQHARQCIDEFQCPQELDTVHADMHQGLATRLHAELEPVKLDGNHLGKYQAEMLQFTAHTGSGNARAAHLRPHQQLQLCASAGQEVVVALERAGVPGELVTGAIGTGHRGPHRHRAIGICQLRRREGHGRQNVLQGHATQQLGIHGDSKVLHGVKAAVGQRGEMRIANLRATVAGLDADRANQPRQATHRHTRRHHAADLVGTVAGAEGQFNALHKAQIDFAGVACRKTIAQIGARVGGAAGFGDLAQLTHDRDGQRCICQHRVDAAVEIGRIVGPVADGHTKSQRAHIDGAVLGAFSTFGVSSSGHQRQALPMQRAHIPAIGWFGIKNRVGTVTTGAQQPGSTAVAQRCAEEGLVIRHGFRRRVIYLHPGGAHKGHGHHPLQRVAGTVLGAHQKLKVHRRGAGSHHGPERSLGRTQRAAAERAIFGIVQIGGLQRQQSHRFEGHLALLIFDRFVCHHVGLGR